MSTWNEVCSCGAELDISDRYDGPSSLSAVAEKFRAEHAVCRVAPDVRDHADRECRCLCWHRGLVSAVQAQMKREQAERQESPYCDWCGRAIYRDGTAWLAVKGVERGYDPLLCDANTEDGIHEPAGQPAENEHYRQDEVIK